MTEALTFKSSRYLNIHSGIQSQVFHHQLSSTSLLYKRPNLIEEGYNGTILHSSLHTKSNMFMYTCNYIHTCL